METTRNPQNLISLILKAVAVAMGIATIVTNLLATATPQGTGTLLGLGLAALAIDALRK
jgi:hypothetical protein